MSLDEDKQKILYEHDLELKRIWLEKGLFAFLAGCIAWFASHELEAYKNDLAVSEYLVRQKLEALQAIRQKYVPLSEAMNAIVLNGKNDDRAEGNAYAKATDAFAAEVNKYAFIFPSQMDGWMNCHYRIHMSVARSDRPYTRDQHLGFAIAVFEDFDRTARLLLSDAKPARGERFKVCTGTQISNAGWATTRAHASFDRLYQAWSTQPRPKVMP